MIIANRIAASFSESLLMVYLHAQARFVCKVENKIRAHLQLHTFCESSCSRRKICPAWNLAWHKWHGTVVRLYLWVMHIVSHENLFKYSWRTTKLVFPKCITEVFCHSIGEYLVSSVY